MKVKRLKHVRKVINFYETNFGFSPPLRVVLDGTFCKAALKCKVNISEQLPKYLGCEVKLFTTSCALAECEALGPLLYGPFKVLQQFDVHPCGHNDPIPASNCLLTLICKQNQRKFMLATQDAELTERVRDRAGVPLLFIAYNAITLEAPAEASRKKAEKRLQDNMVPQNFHKNTLEKLKTEILGPQAVHIKRRKKLKGPNPLSCRKKSKKTIVNSSTENKSKRKRRKKKQTAVSVGV